MVQRQAVRWVKKRLPHHTSVTQLHTNLGWCTLEDRRLDSKLAIFFKIYHYLVTIPLPKYLETPSSQVNKHICIPAVFVRSRSIQIIVSFHCPSRQWPNSITNKPELFLFLSFIPLLLNILTNFRNLLLLRV